MMIGEAQQKVNWMMANSWYLPKQGGSQEQHVSSEDRGKSYGLKMFLSQGKSPVVGTKNIP
jgi:hypothetical protein